MSTESSELIKRQAEELVDANWDIIMDIMFAKERTCAAIRVLHAKIDSSLLYKTPYKEHWTKYANQKTQGEA